MIIWLQKKKFVNLLLTLLIAIEIYYFSTILGGTATGGPPLIAETYHFASFFLLSAFLFILIKGPRKIKSSHIVLTLTISLSYALLDEIHQSFIPGRVPSIGDIFIDSLGIFVSLLIVISITSKHQKLYGNKKNKAINIEEIKKAIEG